MGVRSIQMILGVLFSCKPVINMNTNNCLKCLTSCVMNTLHSKHLSSIIENSWTFQHHSNFWSPWLVFVLVCLFVCFLDNYSLSDPWTWLACTRPHTHTDTNTQVHTRPLNMTLTHTTHTHNSVSGMIRRYWKLHTETTHWVEFALHAVCVWRDTFNYDPVCNSESPICMLIKVLHVT